MSGTRVAVVGAGMTRFMRRAQETGKELAWEAARAALDSCELTLADVDAVCLTSAPDAFDGVHMKGEYLSDGAGGFGKPFIRTYVGGGSGVFTAIQGWYTVASGMFDVALLVAEEKMSSTQPHPQGAFLTIFDNILERPLGPNLLWIFALEMNRYMSAYGLDKRDIASVAVKNKRNAAGHPAALLGQADITVDDVLASEVLAWPVPWSSPPRRRPSASPTAPSGSRGSAGTSTRRIGPTAIWCIRSTSRTRRGWPTTWPG